LPRPGARRERRFNVGWSEIGDFSNALAFFILMRRERRDP
jgi:hypothetical protein